MDEKEFKAAIEIAGKETVNKINSLIDAAKDDNQKVLTEMKTELLNDLGKDSVHIKLMQEQLDKIETSNKAIKEGQEDKKSFGGHIEDMINGEEFKSRTQNGDRFKKEIPFNIKVAGTMLNSGQSGNIPYPDLTAGVSKTADIPVFLAPLCNISQTTSDTIFHIDRTARTDGAAKAAEGAALGQSDMTYTQRSVSVFDIGTFIKISKNMVNDNAFMASEINNELGPLVMRELDDLILNATGSSTIDGIVNSGTTFDVTGLVYATAIPSANDMDVLRTAIGLARRSNWQPNNIFVHPDDYALMQMTKDDNGLYAVPNWVGPGLSVDGVRLVPNTLITAGTFVVADMTKAKLVQRQSLLIESFFEDSDNATKRLLTITAYLRAAFYISAEHATAFQVGTFSTARTAINLV